MAGLAGAGLLTPLPAIADPVVIHQDVGLIFMGHPAGVDYTGTLGPGYGSYVLEGLADIETVINRGTMHNQAGSPGVISLTNLGSFINYGTVSAYDGHAAVFAGDVGNFTNSATGQILSSATGDDILYFNGDVGAFLNLGTIEGEDSSTAVHFLGGAVGTINNEGRIVGGDAGVMAVGGSLESFHNSDGASIEGTYGSLYLELMDIGSVTNAGRIAATDLTGIGLSLSLSETDLLRNEATGVIDGPGIAVVAQLVDVDRIDNAGAIQSEHFGIMMHGNTIGSMTNSGTIVASGGVGATGALIQLTEIDTLHNSGTIHGDDTGLWIVQSQIGTLRNEGTIRGYTAIQFDDAEAHLINAGTIEGDIGVLYYGDIPGSGRVTNSGLIRGTSGTAIDFNFLCDCDIGEDRDDLLTILTGSRLEGAVNFGDGDADTLDFKGFAGDAVIKVPGLEEVVSGARQYLWDRSSEQIAIFDLDGIDGRGVGQGHLDLLVNVNDYLRARGGTTASDSTPDAYTAAPAAGAAEAAVLTALDTGSSPGVTMWSGVLGSMKAGSSASALGGIIAGTHASLDAGLSLGGLAGYAVSSGGPGQRLTSQTAFGGIEGEAALGVATIDFSLIAGAQAHRNSREISGPGGLETAEGRFTAMFLAPTAGVELPVLDADGASISLTARASYVAGRTAAYTETGSSMNLTVGEQSISAFDGRAGFVVSHTVAAADAGAITLGGRGGVFMQHNGGSASVPVSFLGSSVDIATAGAGAYGLYGGVGIAIATGSAFAINADLDGSYRSDGVYGASARAGISGSF